MNWTYLFRWFFCAALFMGFHNNTYAQTDTSFWFVAPDCTSGHAESPIYLRLTAQGLTSTVTVSQPANASFIPITVTIASNSVSTIDLSSRISSIENTPYNQVLNRGLKIVATTPVTVYYEQASGFNPDIFPLKGRNALGTDFMVIAQNTWFNRSFSPTALNKFDIVATEDNTTVTITPSNSIVGHAANVPFTIVLNKGETYCAAATGTNANAHLGGSAVTADKPIAITESDDSIQDTNYGNCADLAGDQLVPIPLLGLKYISIQGYLTGANDKVFIMAVQNGTQVKINGIAVANLNRGQTYSQASNSAPMYIEANKPVSALHISGFGCEVGGAILPQIECTGSKLVGVTRSDNKPIYFNILVPAGGEGNFTYNGSTSTITAGQFQFVPGSGNTWKYARIDMGSILSVGGSAFVANTTTNFHLGLIHGDAASGCRYGYFSGYNRFEATGSFNSPLCVGQTLQLNCNVIGSVSDVTFQWTGPNGFTSTLQNPTITNVTPSIAGKYTCIATKAGCPALPFDLTVVVNAIPSNTASSNAPICAGNTLNFTTANAGTGATYVWTGPNGFSSALQNPSITNATSINSGVYNLSVTNNGCTKTNSINVAINPAPTASASNTGPYCEGQKVQLNSNSNNAGVSYSWAGPNGFTSALQNPFINNAQQAATGNYIVTISQPGCPSAVANTNVMVNPGPGANITGTSPVCVGANTNITGSSPTAGVSYVWSGPGAFSSTLPTIQLNNITVGQSGNYSLTVSKNGCSTTSVFNLTVNSIPNFVAVANTPLCAGDSLTLNATLSSPATNASFVWSGPNGFTSNILKTVLPNATLQYSGNYLLTATVPACAPKNSQVTVLVKPTPVATASSNSPVCANTNLQLLAANTLPGTNFSWAGPGGYGSSLQNNTISNATTFASGNYYVTASLNGCVDKDTINILIKPIPTATIQASFPACRFSKVQLSNLNTTANTTYQWSTAFNGLVSSVQNLVINSFNYADTGKYYLTATANGCSATDSILATIQPSPVIVFNPPVGLCVDKPGYTIAAAENTGIAGSGIFTGNGISPDGFFNPTIAKVGTHPITFTFTANNGCTQSQTQNMTVYPVPIVDAGTNKIMLIGGGVKLDASIAVNSNYNIVWSPAVGLSNPATINPTARPITSQMYKIAVTTANGCFAYDSVFVKVLGNINIPNAFSPNADGVNDVWRIDGLTSFENCEVAVFNRYGSEIFKSKGYTTPWDGTYKGSQVPVGTYYYIIRLNDGFRTQPYSGWVVLLK